MIDMKRQIIVPYGEVLNTNTFCGRTYTLADMFGNIKPEKLGFGINWFGGKVGFLSTVPALGFLACITKGDLRKGKILAMIVPGQTEAYKNIKAVVTDEGRKAVEEFFFKRYPTCTVIWDKIPDKTPAELEAEADAKKEALSALKTAGGNPAAYAKASLEEILDAVKIAETEKANPDPKRGRPSISINENGVVGRPIPEGMRGSVTADAVPGR